ncbi:MAG: DUF167 domain-containing protein [Candidatus Doudnabacteria bacterium]|nr:DUF167 domain-containing protein [Candidatus Doudnabacteria bacterium]
MTITVQVHPNSKKPRIEKDLFGELHIYVNQPPLEGKANKAVTESLAEHFKVSKSRVVLVRGEKSKKKTFEIDV